MEIVEIVRRWGSSASDAVLDPVCAYFKIEPIDGFIAYRMGNETAIVFGDPVSNEKHWPQLVSEFHTFCSNNKKNIIYVSASETFYQFAFPRFCKGSIQYGKDVHIDPQDDPRQKTGEHASLVRRKTKHALKEGVAIHEYFQKKESETENEIENVGKIWLKNRQGPQIFISHVRLFEDPLGKRWFYASKDNKIVGVVTLNEMKKKNGWHLNHLMMTPDAPHGTPELLVAEVLETLAKENCPYVSFGAVVNGSLENIQGFSPVASWVAPKIYSTIQRYYHLESKLKFWEKFMPESEPSYLLFKEATLSIRQLWDLSKAMNATFY